MPLASHNSVCVFVCLFILCHTFFGNPEFCSNSSVDFSLSLGSSSSLCGVLYYWWYIKREYGLLKGGLVLVIVN